MLSYVRSSKRLIAGFLFPFYLLQSCYYSGTSYYSKHDKAENHTETNKSYNTNQSFSSLCQELTDSDLNSVIQTYPKYIKYKALARESAINDQNKTKSIKKVDKLKRHRDYVKHIIKNKPQEYCIILKNDNSSKEENIKCFSENTVAKLSSKKTDNTVTENSRQIRKKYLPALVDPNPNLEMFNLDFVTLDRYKIQLLQQGCFWKANIIDESVIGFTRQILVPVFCEVLLSNMQQQSSCGKGAVLDLNKFCDPETNLFCKNKIHINNKNIEERIFVYLGEKMGLKGGMDFAKNFSVSDLNIESIVNIGKCTVGGALVGGFIGLMFGPIGSTLGAVIGGVVGAVAGFLNEVFCKDSREEQERKIRDRATEEIWKIVPLATEYVDKGRDFGARVERSLNENSPSPCFQELPKIIDNINNKMIAGLKDVLRQMVDFRGQISYYGSCVSLLNDKIISPLESLINDLTYLADSKFPKMGEKQVLAFLNKFTKNLDDPYLEKLLCGLKEDADIDYEREFYAKEVLFDLPNLNSHMRTRNKTLRSSIKFYDAMKKFFDNYVWKSWSVTKNFEDDFKNSLEELDEAIKRYDPISPNTSNAAFKHFDLKKEETEYDLTNFHNNVDEIVDYFSELYESFKLKKKDYNNILEELREKFTEGLFFEELNETVEDYKTSIVNNTSLFADWENNCRKWRSNINNANEIKINISGLLKKIQDHLGFIKNEERYLLGDSKIKISKIEEAAVLKLKDLIQNIVRGPISEVIHNLDRNDQEKYDRVSSIFWQYDNRIRQLEQKERNFKEQFYNKYKNLARDLTGDAAQYSTIEFFERAYKDKDHGYYNIVHGSVEYRRKVEESLHDRNNYYSDIVKYKDFNSNYRNIRSQIDFFETYGENIRKNCIESIKYLEEVLKWQNYINISIEDNDLIMNLQDSLYPLIDRVFETIKKLVKLEGPQLERYEENWGSRTENNRKEFAVYDYLNSYADHSNDKNYRKDEFRPKLISKRVIKMYVNPVNIIDVFIQDSIKTLGIYCGEQSKNYLSFNCFKPDADRKIGKSVFGGGDLDRLKNQARQEILANAATYNKLVNDNLEECFMGDAIDIGGPSCEKVMEEGEKELEKRIRRRENTLKAFDKLKNVAELAGVTLNSNFFIKLDESAYDPPFQDSGMFLVPTKNILSSSKINPQGNSSKLLSLERDVENFKDILGKFDVLNDLKSESIANRIEVKLKKSIFDYNSLVMDYKISESFTGSRRLLEACGNMLSSKFSEEDFLMVMNKCIDKQVELPPHCELDEKTFLYHSVQKNYSAAFSKLLFFVNGPTAFFYDDGKLENLIYSSNTRQEIKDHWGSYKKKYENFNFNLYS